MIKIMSTDLALLAALLIPIAVNADAVTLTFNGTVDDGQEVWLHIGDTYSEGGFTLTVLTGDQSYLIDKNSTGIDDLDDDAFTLDTPESSALITRDGGGLFDAIDVLVGHTWWSRGVGNLDFTGFYGGGGIIVTTATGCGLNCLDSFAFDGFVGLESLLVSAGEPFAFMVIDDLRLTPVTVPEPVTIDIKPGSEPNCFNANGHGVVPVAILGSDSFDVTEIAQDSLSFGGLEVSVRGNKGPLCHVDYSDGDEYLDLVCQFEDNSGYWSPGDGEATLTGSLINEGGDFEGTDSICVVP